MCDCHCVLQIVAGYKPFTRFGVFLVLLSFLFVLLCTWCNGEQICVLCVFGDLSLNYLTVRSYYKGADNKYIRSKTVQHKESKS